MLLDFYTEKLKANIALQNLNRKAWLALKTVVKNNLRYAALVLSSVLTAAVTCALGL